MFKKIAIVITLVLALGLGFFLWSTSREEGKQAATQEEVELVRRPLLVKKQQLEQKLVDLDKNYEAKKIPRGTTQVIFTGLEADVYNICYPIMKKFEYTGILAISLTQLPGMEGLMSLEQFQELIQEGWTICIKWDAEIPVNNWWPELQKQVKQLGLQPSSVVYFTTGTYSSKLDAQIVDMGFSVVVHHGENGSLIQLNDEEGLWHLGAVGLMGEKPKIRLTEAIAQKGNIAYLVGFALEDELYNERSFVSMLSYFDAHEASQELLVSNIEATRQHYRDRLAVYEQEREEEYKQAKAVIEEELATVETQLRELELQ